MDEYFTEVMGEKKAKSIDILMENYITINHKSYYDCSGDGYLKNICIEAIIPHSEDDSEIVIATMNVQVLLNLSFLSFDEVISYCDIPSANFNDVCLTFLKSEFDEENEDGYIDIVDRGDFIYIDRFEVNKEYRGLGYGEAIAIEIIETLKKVSDIIVVKPFAIEDEENETSHLRVRKFWEGVGFKDVDGEYFGYELDDYNIEVQKKDIKSVIEPIKTTPINKDGLNDFFAKMSK